MPETEAGHEQWSVRHVEWEVPNEDLFEMMEKYLVGVEETMRAFNWSDEDIYRAQFGLNELAQNAIIHGNLDWNSPQETNLDLNDESTDREDQIKEKITTTRLEGKKTSIKIWGDVSAEQATFFVQDHGKKFEKTDKPTTDNPVLNEQGQFVPSGFGGKITDAFENEVVHEFNETGTLTTLHRKKSK